MSEDANHTDFTQKISRPLSKLLCDSLAIRVDALPWPHPHASMNTVLDYCEGGTLYQKLQEGVWFRWANDPALGLTEAGLSRLNLTLHEFQRQYSPEAAFSRSVVNLLTHNAKDGFDAGLEPIIQTYLHTPSPRSSEERLRCLIGNRARTCPDYFEQFLWALWRGDRVRLSEASVFAVKVFECADPGKREILTESYAYEVKLAKDCLVAIELEQDAFYCRTRELLQEYGAVRVERKRRLL